MKKPIFQGSGVAIVTPFTENGINYDKFANLIEFQIKNKTDAIIVAGTTGESSTMPDEEHLDAVRFVVETVNGRVPVIAGTGSNDTRHAIDLSVKAESLGADGLLSVTPYYNKSSQEGLYRHFKAIQDAVSTPIILYNVPGRTAVNLSPETMYRLAQLPNINGVKECKIDQAAATAHLCGDDMNLYTGEDGMIMPMLSLGGKGVISVMANLVPEMTHEITEAWFSKDIASAISLQVKLTPLIDALFCEVNPIPVKAALNLMGFEVGPCRMPLCEPSDASMALLRNTLKDYDLLPESK